MLSDRAKIENAKSALRRQYAIGDILTTGQLEQDKFYLIIHFDSRDDLKNVGAPNKPASDLDGWVFKATGTTPTVFNNGTKLQKIDVAALKTDADAVFKASTATVTLKSVGSEGGSASGDITFEKALLSMAYEELIAELDPDYVLPAPVPRRSVGTTVRLGF